MAHLSEKANELYEEYMEIYKIPPRGWAHGEETMKEYEIYLEKQINEFEKKS